MNARNFMLLILAAYLNVLGAVLSIFKMGEFFLREFFVTIILIVFGFYALSNVYKKKTYGASALFFGALLLNTVNLYFVAGISFYVFAIMVLSGIFGMILSIKNMSPSKTGEDYSFEGEFEDIPKFMSEVYDIKNSKLNKKTVKKKAKKKKAVKKRKVVKKK